MNHKYHFFFVILVSVLCSMGHAKDLKVLGQELMPIGGTGPDGKVAGVYADLVRQACAKLNHNCTYQIVSLARMMEMIKSGEGHIGLGLAKTPDREEFALFPPNVTLVGYTWTVKKGTASKFTKPEDFNGYTVGVHGGSATGKDLIEQNKKIGGGMKIVEEAVVETALKKLAGGRYGDKAAAYCIRPMCLLQSKKENFDLEPVSFDGKLQSHTTIVSKKAFTPDEYQAWVKAIKEVASSAEFQKSLTDQGMKIHPDILKN